MGRPFSRSNWTDPQRRRHCDPFVLGVVRRGFGRHQHKRRRHAVLDRELARGVLAMLVHRARLDPQRPRDLFRVMVRMNQPQAFPLARRQ